MWCPLLRASSSHRTSRMAPYSTNVPLRFRKSSITAVRLRDNENEYSWLDRRGDLLKWPVPSRQG